MSMFGFVYKVRQVIWFRKRWGSSILTTSTYLQYDHRRTRRSGPQVFMTRTTPIHPNPSQGRIARSFKWLHPVLQDLACEYTGSENPW